VLCHEDEKALKIKKGKEERETSTGLLLDGPQGELWRRVTSSNLTGNKQCHGGKEDVPRGETSNGLEGREYIGGRYAGRRGVKKAFSRVIRRFVRRIVDKGSKVSGRKFRS